MLVMKQKRRGFTLIEVAIFLAVTGALFVAVTAGVQNSIYQQRVNDSVQNFMEFIRQTYAEVSNVQNLDNKGRTDTAIYGRLMVFGETHDLAGESLEPDQHPVFVYTVVGDVLDEPIVGDVKKLLKDLHASITVTEQREDGSGEELRLAGFAESYTPKWATRIEEVEPVCTGSNCEYEPLEGMVLIVRHPSSGVTYTLYHGETEQINEKLRMLRDGGTSVDTNFLNIDDFGFGQIDFCINPTGEDGVFYRNDVRIKEGARNASALELVPDEDNICIRR